MKVLIVRNSFDYNFGGAEKLSVAIAKELQNNSIDVLLVTKQPRLLEYAAAKDIPRKKGLWWASQNWSGLRLLFLPAYLLWLICLIVWYMLLISKTRPDVLHLMSKDDFIAGSIAGSLLRKGVVWTDCADLKFLYRNHRVWYKNPVGKLVFWVAGLADTITLVSENEKRLIESEVGKTLRLQYQVVYTVGSDERIEPANRDTDKSVTIFCSTSRLVVDKGIGELIEAFNAISRGSTAYKLWLIGDGPDSAEFKRLAGKNPHITFFGHTTKPLPLLAVADIYVHPTYHEGFSLSIAEAAMLGKPMIATDVGGNPELVNETNGVLVPAKDAAAFATAMRTLADDKKLLARFGKQARKDFLEKFNLSMIVSKQLIDLYEKANH